MLFALLQSALSDCSTNALRDIYRSSSFTLLTASGTGYEYLANSSSKVTDFVAASPASDNWCANDTGVMGTVS